MKKKVLVFILTICSLLTLFGCDKCGNLEEILNVPTLSVNQAIITLKPHETFEIEAKWTGEGEVTFAVDNSAVASVDNSGLVTAIASGEAVVTVSAGDKTKNCYVTVIDDGEVPVITVSNVIGGEVALNVGASYVLDVGARFNGESIEDATISASSSDSSVISVDDKFVIKALAKGEAYVQIEGSWRNFTKSVLTKTIKVIVKDNVTFDLVSEYNDVYAVSSLDGKDYRVSTSLIPRLFIGDNEVKDGFIYHSSESEILTVAQDGVATGKKIGTSIVTCIYEDAELGNLYASKEMVVQAVIEQKQLDERFLIEKGENPSVDTVSVLFADDRKAVEIFDITDKEKEIQIFSDGKLDTNEDLMPTGERVWQIFNDAYAYEVEVMVVDHVVSSASDMRNVFPKGGNKYIILDRDIPNVGRFASESKFYGILDGQGHTISDIDIVSCGLFGVLDGGATIRNLAVSNATLAGTSGVFGVQSNNATIENVSVWITGAKTTPEIPCGGAVFQIGGTLTIKNSIFYIEGVENQNFGAVVGSWWGGQYNTINSAFVTSAKPVGNYSGAKNIQQAEDENSKEQLDYIYKDTAVFLEELSKSVSKIDLNGFNKEVWMTPVGTIPTFISDAGIKEKMATPVKGNYHGDELFYFSKNLETVTDYAESFVSGGCYNVKLPDTIQGNTISYVYVGANNVSGYSFDKSTRVLKIPTEELADVVCGETNVIIKTDLSLVSIKATVADFVLTSAEEFKNVLPNCEQEFGAASYYHIVLGNDIYDVDNYLSKANLRGVFDGKGYTVRNVSMNSDSHAIFSSLRSSGVIKNVAFVNVSYVTNHKCAPLVNEHYGKIENVFLSGISNGFAFVNANYEGSTISNCVINVVGNDERLLNDYAIGTSSGKVEDCYAISNYTSGVAENVVGGASFSNANDMLESLNKSLPEGFNDSWSFGDRGALLFDGKSVVNFRSDIIGDKNGGELYYFGKIVDLTDGYSSENVVDGKYKMSLPTTVTGSIDYVSVGGKGINGFNFENSVLYIPVSELASVVNGNTQITLGVEETDYVAKVTVADYVLESSADVQAVLPNVTREYIVLGNDITWAGNNYTRTLKPDFSGTLDGKGYAIKGMKADIHLFNTLQRGARICNIAFLNATYTAAAGWFANETAGGIEFENIAITYLGNGGGGLIGSPQGSLSVKDTIIIGAETTNALCNSYKAGVTLTLTNSYFITDKTSAIKVNAGESDTTNFYETANSAVCNGYESLMQKSNELASFDINYWTIIGGYLCYNEHQLLKSVSTLKGEKFQGELFYFSKNIDTVSGYVANNVVDGKYKVTLPGTISNVAAVSVGNTVISDFTYDSGVLYIPVTALSSVASGSIKVNLTADGKDLVATATLADYVLESSADVQAVLPNVSSDYVVVGCDITWSGNNYTRTAKPDFSGTLDGKGYAINGMKADIHLFNTLQRGARICNIAFLNATYTAAAGWFANETAGGIEFENILMTYSGNGGGGLIGSPQGSLSVKDTIVVGASTTNTLCNSYRAGITLTLTNSYFVTNKTSAIKTDAGESDTTNVYETANAALCLDVTALMTKSNNLADFDSALWFIDSNSNICFGGQIVISAQ